MKKFIKNNFSNKNNGESKESDFNDNLEFKDFVDYSAVGIFKLNTDTIVEYANQTLAQILDYKSRSDLIGINFKDELFSESTDWEKIRTKLFKHRIAKNFIVPLKQNSGASIFVRVDIRASSDNEGNTTSFEGSITDVSDFVKNENRIKKELQLLKEEKENDSPVITQTAQFNSDHISKMIHKFKTPINSIVGFLTLIEHGMFNSDEELKDFSHKARVSASSLTGIIDEITNKLNTEGTDNSDEIIEEIADQVLNTDENKEESTENIEIVPTKDSDEQNDIITEDNSISNSGKKILLVEDNPISQNVEMRLLKESGYSVVAVTNGEDAIEAVKTNEFSLVLMDVEMPNMDGINATKFIRKLEPSIKQIPIIAVTAHSSMKDREKCLASGMNDYIAKPININFMKMTIDQWLQRKVEI